MTAGLRVLAAVALFAGSAFAQDPVSATPSPEAIPAAAAPAQPTPAPAPAAYKPEGGSTVQLSLYLALLLGLLAGGAYLLRNGFTIFQPKLKGERKLQISETRMLGNRQFLVVAEYEGRKLLLGVCPGRIDYLSTLAGPEPEFPNISPEKHDV